MIEIRIPEDFVEGKECLENEVPWQVPESIFKEAQYLRHTDNVLELGSGGSTLFFARRCRNVTSIETDKDYYNVVADKLSREEIDNVDYQLEDDEEVLCAKIHAMDTSKINVFSVDTQGGKYDRSRLLSTFLNKGVSPNLKMIVLDNYSHPGLFPLHHDKEEIPDLPNWNVFTFNHPRWAGDGTRLYVKKPTGPQTFLHSGNIGDVWAAIPALREFTRRTGRKVILYLAADIPGMYYEGASHPTKSADGTQVMLNPKMIEMMLPLLKMQPFIENAKMWEGEYVGIDLDDIRRTSVWMPAFPINRWYMYRWPDMSCDVTVKWLEVPDSEKDLCKGKVLINRTERYNNEHIDYSFLQKYQDQCMFIGTTKEWKMFTMMYDLYIEKLDVENFLEYAQAIKQCKFYMSNQSQGFQLAQGLLHPRLVEIWQHAPNVMVHGEKAYDFTSNVAAQFLFEELLK